MTDGRDRADSGLIYSDEVFRIQGAVFEVSREMGTGFLEAVYQECLSHELALRGIPFETRRPLALTYKGRILERTYVPDFVCYDAIILELKSVSALLPEHRAQIIDYLRASRLKLGLLINFGRAPKAQIERFVARLFEPRKTRKARTLFGWLGSNFSRAGGAQAVKEPALTDKRSCFSCFSWFLILIPTAAAGSRLLQ